ncbi:MAG: carbamoyl-phosphate synthase (glutamine-hydrolyzing) large subunit [Conexivisphaera sp.]
MREAVSKALVLGSGGIKIAEAAEFDYSGSQALKALSEEGIRTVLINPNIATIQTSHRMADRVYFVPLTPWFAERVIERERPDAVLLGFGGQSALSLGVQLHRSGVLAKYGVKVLGTQVDGIASALDRAAFRDLMYRRGYPVPPSVPASSIEEAVGAADDVGYPVIVRVSFNLGGRGSFVARSRKELSEGLSRAFSHSPVKGVLVERYLEKWKEIEFEVVRDRAGNSVAVACIENLEPMGVHTGDSTVIAPCQTLTDREYQELRRTSMGVAASIGLLGECNVQLALRPQGDAYYVIETNPRMSRSSALASKATGYPLAYVAAKLALGYTLDEVLNKVTGDTSAFFEPSLDYLVIKAPRWDLQKFWPVDDRLGSEMMSVGEVMSMGRGLEEVLQKAFRMLDIGVDGLVGPETYAEGSAEEVLRRLESFRPYWLLDAARAMALGVPPELISEMTGVAPLFMRAVHNVVRLGRELMGLSRADERTRRRLLAAAARMGFTPGQVSRLSGLSPDEVEEIMEDVGAPVVKDVDTLAGERPARTGYLYLTWNGNEDDVGKVEGRGLIALGAGGFRIGVSVEFDWALVEITRALEDLGFHVGVVNYNPETVSTDWDFMERVYNAELEPHSILWVARKHGTNDVIVFAGGQLGNNAAEALEAMGLRLLGTPAGSIARAEDRSKFGELVERLGLLQPSWTWARSVEDALDFAESNGYPVIVRPSYVLSGSSMFLARNREELRELMRRILERSTKPVVVSRFLEGAIEAEADCASDGREVLMLPMEHVEGAGVHSGDATMSIPTRRLTDGELREMAEAAQLLARELRIVGPFNLQYLVKDGRVYVLELNLRSSRSMPFASKSYGVNLMEVSAAVLAGRGIEVRWPDAELQPGVHVPDVGFWSVKSPQFSWAQIRGAYPFLGPEMRSTGEVASMGTTFREALLKSWMAASPNRVPEPDKTALIYGRGLERAQRSMARAGYGCASLRGSGVRGCAEVEIDDAVRMVKEGEVGILMTDGYAPEVDYRVRRAAVDHNVPVVLNRDLAAELAAAIEDYMNGRLELSVMELREYWEAGRGRLSRPRWWTGAST